MSSDILKTRTTELPVSTGLAREDREKLAKLLNETLAGTYVLYAKTHAFHWNVSGPLFYSIHKMTDEQYRDLASAIDEIAERIRALGFPAVGGLANYLELSVVKDAKSMPSTHEMVETLAEDHQLLAGKIREAVAEAEKLEDVYTADLLTARIGVHEEAAWMLNAILAE